MEENKSLEINPDDLKLLVEQNEYLKLWLKSLNGIPMSDEDETIDYMSLWEKIALRKKIESSEVNFEDIEFYFNLFSCGLDNFGEQCFASMAKTDPGALGYGIKCLLEIITDRANKFEEE